MMFLVASERMAKWQWCRIADSDENGENWNLICKIWWWISLHVTSNFLAWITQKFTVVHLHNFSWFNNRIFLWYFSLYVDLSHSMDAEEMNCWLKFVSSFYTESRIDAMFTPAALRFIRWFRKCVLSHPKKKKKITDKYNSFNCAREYSLQLNDDDRCLRASSWLAISLYLTNKHLPLGSARA